MHYIIDVSKWQGKIDWNKLANDKGAQAPFAAIIRIGYGEKSIDPYAHTNLAASFKVGMPRGIYWYAPEPLKTNAQVEKIAQKCFDFCKIYRPEYPVFLDIEGNQDWEKPANIAKLVDYWVKCCENLGMFPGIYGSEKVLFANKYLSRNLAWWVANYSKKPVIPCNMWQFTSGGSAAGVSGRVDLSECYADYKKIIKEGKYNLWN